MNEWMDRRMNESLDNYSIFDVLGINVLDMGTIFFPLSSSFGSFALLYLLFLDIHLTCVA